MNRTLDVASSMAATALRLAAGGRARPRAKRPEKLLELYEFEACPFCRKLREAMSVMDLEAMIYPCPRGGRYRERVIALGGKAQFPFLVDPNTSKQMYESADIIRYLVTTYGAEAPTSLGPLTILFSGLASTVRGNRGRIARAARIPEQPLQLWSFEGSPYCRIARERLCELQLPYHLVNVAANSVARPGLLARAGKVQSPYLEDPNTGAKMFESADIVDYLEKTYAVAS